MQQYSSSSKDKLGSGDLEHCESTEQSSKYPIISSYVRLKSRTQCSYTLTYSRLGLIGPARRFMSGGRIIPSCLPPIREMSTASLCPVADQRPEMIMCSAHTPQTMRCGKGMYRWDIRSNQFTHLRQQMRTRKATTYVFRLFLPLTLFRHPRIFKPHLLPYFEV